MPTKEKWNGRFKDWVKLGLSPSTSVTTIDCRKTVEVDVVYLKMLEDSSDLLACLDACGVHNWLGYGEANEMLIRETEGN